MPFVHVGVGIIHTSQFRPSFLGIPVPVGRQRGADLETEPEREVVEVFGGHLPAEQPDLVEGNFSPEINHQIFRSFVGAPSAGPTAGQVAVHCLDGLVTAVEGRIRGNIYRANGIESIYNFNFI